jgi:hypothetical protein
MTDHADGASTYLLVGQAANPIPAMSAITRDPGDLMPYNLCLRQSGIQEDEVSQ